MPTPAPHPAPRPGQMCRCRDRMAEPVVVALKPVAEEGPAAQLWVVAAGARELVCRAEYLAPLEARPCRA